jgi:hypothetical protein
MTKSTNKKTGWLDGFYKIASIIGVVVALAVSIRSCTIARETKVWTKNQIDLHKDQVDLLRKDIEISNLPLLELRVHTVDLINDLYLTNKGKGTASNVVILCSPKEAFGGKFQKTLDVIAPGERIRVFRIFRPRDFNSRKIVNIRAQFSDVLGQIYSCIYEGPFRHMTLKGWRKQEGKNKTEKTP